MKRGILKALFLFLSISLAALSLAPSSGHNAAAGWTSIGPDGGSILAIAESGSNHNLTYALATNVQGQVFLSLNGGSSWKRKAWIRDFVYDLAVNPKRPDTVYVLWMKGVYKSTDRGSTWTKYAFQAPHSTFGRIAVHPHNPSLVYATGIYVADQTTWKSGMALFKSNTGGRTWSYKRIIPSSSQGQARALAVDPANPRTIYVGGWYTTDVYRDGLFKSTDGGTNWTEITGTIVEEPTAILVDPANPSRLCVGTIAGVYRSVNGGLTWTKIQGIPAATVLAADPSADRVFYAGDGTKIYRSSDAGARWSALSSAAYGTVACLSLSAGRMFYGASGGLYKSTTEGGSWIASHKGIRAAMIGAPSVSLAAAGTLYGVVPSMGIVKSADSGATWTKLPDFERSRNILGIAPHPTNPKILYALGTGPLSSSGSSADPLPSLYRTVNGGTSWIKLLTAAVSDFKLSRKTPSRVFAAGKSGSGRGEVMALYTSANAGKTWTTHTAYAAANTHVYELAVDPSNDKIIYIGGDQAVYTKLFLKSGDGGLTWINLSASLPGIPIGRIVFDPSNSRNLYNVHSVGIYRSEDEGASWTKIDTGDFQAESMVIDPAAPDHLMIAGSAGVRMSTDSGLTWTDITGSLPIKNVIGLAMDPVNRTLFAGTYGASLYKKTL